MAKRGTMPSRQGLSRRQMLRCAGVAAVASLWGRAGGVTAAAGDTGGAALVCVARPRQTEGPYFVDTRLERSDLRSDPTDGTRKPGVPVVLAFHVSRFDDDACTPLAGAVVDLWQCDALGVYSGVQDFAGRFDTREQRFLRGYQVTDSRGMARFTTLYPGWYSGRAVHIHFKIRTDPEADLGLEFTSQLYFDDALTDRVHQQPPYAERGPRNVRNDADGIYRRSGGDELVLDLTESGEGYRGDFQIALAMH
ncbi:intradiol ring-cleavage dioxygenase [Halomonas stenophila]|uniref:Protocatechuate 3,4-dioxygenase beta subunit n=1 Tax=Halomonas stenophila TaxID=795312 RepID=A0A7W5HL72_9GAMM|nr:intradiol ring-cleavage dioxygenase [Halomonas stenophila]MBB3232570.1 protocatechuate 3,4-dioxygenase beta subunit [Halomonas stenophila]